MNYKSLRNEEKWIVKSIPILFLIGSSLHFLYELSGNSKIVGIFAAVSESVWEHSKMVLFPVILWWIIFYLLKGEKYKINKEKWFEGALVALITPIILIPMIFYFYTGALGVESLIFDIIILLIGILVGQLLGLHFYKYSKGMNPKLVIFIFILIIIVFALFTFKTPHLPIFKDALTGGYGIG